MSKSKLFLSANTCPQFAQSLSCQFEIPWIGDLGTYLDAPILHGRVGTKSYGFLLLDKAKNKISGWKCASLSKVAKLLLINTNIASSTTYVMQYTLIPQHTISELE